MKILILGHKGMLGQDLYQRLVVKYEVVGKDIDDFDIASINDCENIVSEVQPDIVINAAAYTDVDGCETERERCFAVNAEGVKNIALACRDRGIRIVHFSTDYVFDGAKTKPYREDDECNPLNVYGRAKHVGERYLQELSDSYLLIRSSWLYGRGGKNFVKTIIDKARSEGSLEVVDDQRGCPTYTWDLAAAVQMLIEGNHSGIFHVTNRGNCSWYEFAVKIIQIVGLNVTVKPIKSSELRRRAVRPSYSVLSNRKFVSVTGKAMRFWQVALDDFIGRTGY